jgi:hypothetical protein
MEGGINQASSLKDFMAHQLSVLRLSIYPDNIKISKVSPISQGELSYGRSNFFIHGGTTPGTGGCIQIGRSQEMEDHFFSRIETYSSPIPLYVRY